MSIPLTVGKWRIVGGYRADGTRYTLPEKDQEVFEVLSCPPFQRVLGQTTSHTLRIEDQDAQADSDS